mmetsp:Transcript_29344/g.54947  ORF Transcript_29344/g.54947 Transcript_29344/m.54947 type:complete len:287 (-) Transcript_29344:88-948(-)
MKSSTSASSPSSSSSDSLSSSAAFSSKPSSSSSSSSWSWSSSSGSPSSSSSSSFSSSSTPSAPSSSSSSSSSFQFFVRVLPRRYPVSRACHVAPSPSSWVLGLAWDLLIMSRKESFDSEETLVSIVFALVVESTSNPAIVASFWCLATALNRATTPFVATCSSRRSMWSNWGCTCSLSASSFFILVLCRFSMASLRESLLRFSAFFPMGADRIGHFPGVIGMLISSCMTSPNLFPFCSFSGAASADPRRSSKSPTPSSPSPSSPSSSPSSPGASLEPSSSSRSSSA